MSTVADARRRLRRGWDYYRRYTKHRTGIHAAATAALTGFGLLAYYERWFVFVAIVAYLVPPVYLYLAGDDLGDSGRSGETTDERHELTSTDIDSTRTARRIAIDADVDGTDADFDSDDGDTDSDDGDTDSDSDDGDTDGDSDTD